MSDVIARKGSEGYCSEYPWLFYTDLLLGLVVTVITMILVGVFNTIRREVEALILGIRVTEK